MASGMISSMLAALRSRLWVRLVGLFVLASVVPLLGAGWITARLLEERARTEMRYFKQLFGVDLSIKSQADYAARLSMMNGTDIAFAIEAGLDEAALDRRLDQNAARLQGFNEAKLPLAPVFTYQSRR